MATQATPAIVEPSAAKALWFMGTLTNVRLDGTQTAGRFAIFETELPKDAAPPLHTHPQDETFVVLDGTLTVWVGNLEKTCTPGHIVFAPGGTPHTFIVESETARMLTVSTPAGIEAFARALSQPAREPRLPTDDEYPSDADIEAALAAHHVEIVGPRPTAATKHDYGKSVR